LKLFSAFGAAQALEKDRQTIERAVRGLAPDGFERGQPRWRLSRIIEVLNSRYGKGEKAPMNAVLRDLFDRRDDADAAMRVVGALEDRRRFARDKLIPLLRQVDAAMRADGKAGGEPEIATALRVDRHTQLFLAGLGSATTQGCDWPLEHAYREFNGSPNRAMDEQVIS
jgi:hypothetical protein